MKASASASLLDRLQARGWRTTTQRRAVAVVLAGCQIHLTAEEIHERARRVNPEVSLATVYNTLHSLVAMGEVSEIRISGATTRYDPNTLEPHQHLACERCGRLWDVHPKGIEALELADAERHGFWITTVDVVFRGLCPDCAGGR